MNIVQDNLTMRAASSEDKAVLFVMLKHAAHESSTDTVRNNPELMRYVDSWGRSSDVGIIAEIDSKPVGAAWLRLWTKGDRGYGYLDDETPELAIAVVPESRGKGIGTSLLEQLLTVACSEFPSVSLSIRADNLALRLYERFGFVRVAGTEVTNRAGSVSFSMCRPFNSDKQR